MPLEMFKDGHLGGYIRGGDPQTFCPYLWQWFITTQDIHSVLDIGCGEGHSAKFYKELGCEVLGVEGCRQAVEDSVIPQHVILHDFCRGPFKPKQRFDMVWCCEFLEHVEERYLPFILQAFQAADRFILLTHAQPGQEDGHHHVNCQPSRYWLKKFREIGFACDIPLTVRSRVETLKDFEGINHFARSGLVFRRVRSTKKPLSLDFLSDINDWNKTFFISRGFKASSAYRQRRRQLRIKKRGMRQRQKAALR